MGRESGTNCCVCRVNMRRRQTFFSEYYFPLWSLQRSLESEIKCSFACSLDVFRGGKVSRPSKLQVFVVTHGSGAWLRVQFHDKHCTWFDNLHLRFAAIENAAVATSRDSVNWNCYLELSIEMNYRRMRKQKLAKKRKQKPLHLTAPRSSCDLKTGEI